MTKREQIIYKTMSENIARAGEFGLCPEPFVVMRAEYQRIAKRNLLHTITEIVLAAALTVTLCVLLSDPAEAVLDSQDALIIQSANTTETEAEAWEDPDEEEKTREAIKAKSNVIEDCIITGYCADCTPYAHMNRDEFGRVLTSSGQWVWIGSCVATDPSVIPTGSTVVIGDETYIALDAGVKGNHVDILMHHDDAAVAGVRRETVWWCEERE